MRRLVLGIATVLVVGSVLVGCSGPSEEGSQDGGPTPVRLAVPQRTLFTTGLPIYVAQEQGFYDKLGLKVEPIYTSGGGDTVQTVISGSADMAIETGPSSILGPYAEGAPLKIVSASTTGMDVFWFAKSDGPYKALQDLSGQKVGFSSPGSSSDLGVGAINNILADEGLPKATPEAVGGPPDQLTAVKTDQIAAGWSTPPLLLDQVNDGQLRIVVRGAELTEYKDVAVRVDVANARYIEQNPESVRAFLEAQQMAWEWIFANPDEAVGIWKKSAGLKDDPELLKQAFDFYEPEQLRLTPLDGRDKIVEDAVKSGAIDERLSKKQMDDVFDLRYALGAE